MVNLGIGQTNQAFLNSRIYNIRVARANVRKWEGFVERPNRIDRDLSSLMKNNNVAHWRQDDLADVVCLITDGRYEDEDGKSLILGIVGQNLGNPRQDQAFMIVEGWSFAGKLFVFSHELGHVIGCRHQTCATYNTSGCDDEGAFEHGHGWGERRCRLCKWRNYNTIMHLYRDGNTALLRYSNPEVAHNGYPTGIPNERDNARWIRTNGCIVSNYNDDPVFPLSVRIEGESLLCQPLVGDYYTIVTGSASPYSYEWHVSTDGVDWGTVASTQPSIALNSNHYYPGSSVFLRVRVTNTLGNVEFAFFTVTIISTTNHGACNRSKGSEGDIAAVKVYPNPATDNLNILFTVVEDGSPASIRLCTVTGVTVAEIHRVLSAGEHREILPLEGASVGPFLLWLKVGQKTCNKLIIKQ